MKIAVYVTLFNNFDSLKEIPEDYRDEASYFLFTDGTEAGDYNKITVDSSGRDPRRLSREIKIYPFDRIPGFDYYIYLDATISLRDSPILLVDKYLKNHDIAVLKHPWRDCIYDEMWECMKLGICDTNLTLIQEQLYRSFRYPEHNGLTENGVMLRRDNYSIREFSLRWLGLYKQYAERDQFSFCYVAWEKGIKYNIIPNDIRGEGKEFHFTDHVR